MAEEKELQSRPSLEQLESPEAEDATLVETESKPPKAQSKPPKRQSKPPKRQSTPPKGQSDSVMEEEEIPGGDVAFNPPKP